MFFVVREEDVEEIGKIFEKYGFEWMVVGEIIKELCYIVYWKGEKVVDFLIDFFMEVLMIEWEMRFYSFERDVEIFKISFFDVFEFVWSSLNVLNKCWVWE